MKGREGYGGRVERISELAEENEGAGEMEKAEEVLGLALVAGDEAPEAMEPGEESLYHPAPPVAPQLPAILRLAAAPTMWSNQLHATLVPEPLIESVAVVGLVPDESLGQFVKECLVERGLEDLDLVG
jgi:hypothetical protein